MQTQPHSSYQYLVVLIRTPDFQESVIPDHIAFLDELRKQNRLELAGPFTDKSGGAYIIKASSLAEAQELVHADPVYTSKSSLVTVYEWNAS